MKRTQLYIGDSLFQRLTRIGRQQHKTISELVRQGLEWAYFRPSQKEALESVRGLWKNRRFSTERYIRRLRSDRKLPRF